MDIYFFLINKKNMFNLLIEENKLKFSCTYIRKKLILTVKSSIFFQTKKKKKKNICKY